MANRKDCVVCGGEVSEGGTCDACEKEFSEPGAENPAFKPPHAQDCLVSAEPMTIKTKALKLTYKDGTVLYRVPCMNEWAFAGVHPNKYMEEARPRNYPVPDEIEQVLVRGCEGCPCRAVYLSEKGDPPEDHCSLLDKEVFATINLIDPECPLKKKHHILMLSTTEE